MNLPVQKNRFQVNWGKFSPHFPQKNWQSSPDFLYFIEIPIKLGLQSSMQSICQKIQAKITTNSYWVLPENMHITLALPGRLGVHFQGNDVTRMTKKITEILQQFNIFSVQLGAINCFADTIFREVYDPSGQLSLLHYKLCEAIPFAQAPEFQFEHFLPHVSFFYAENVLNSINLNEVIVDRQLKPETMIVDTIAFGRSCREMNGTYEREVIKTYPLFSA